jgi:peptidyl-prolyl cis-trans isomerase C
MPITLDFAGARAVLMAGCLIGLAACGRGSAPQTPPQPGDREVARVNGAPVWTSDVKREAVAQGMIGPGEPLDVSSVQFHEVLDEVIDQKLLAAEAVKRGLDKDVAAQRRLAAARDRILGDLLLESSVGKKVSESAVAGIYKDMLSNAAPTEQLQLRQVVVSTEAEAQQVKTLLAGGVTFDVVAAERSKDEATRFKGGQLGPVNLDLLPPAYGPALKTAKVGQLVGPFRSDQGWIVARIDDRRTEPPATLDAVRPQIIRFLTYDQVKDLILNLRREAKVETLIPPAQDVPGAPREPASAPIGPASQAAPSSPQPETKP